MYRFYGLNALPLYVGKSVNLRARIAAHFSQDYRSANDLRLSAEITRIEIEETAGELGALLRESQLVKTLLPAYNKRLRRRAEMVALAVAEEPEAPDYVRSNAIDPRSLEHLYGPFASIRGRFGPLAIRPDARIRRVPVEMVSAQNQSLHRPVGPFDGRPASGADRLAMAGGKSEIALGPGPPFSTRRPGDARAGPNAAASGRFVGLVGGPGALPPRRTLAWIR